jgi:hypothetical protein
MATGSGVVEDETDEDIINRIVSRVDELISERKVLTTSLDSVWIKIKNINDQINDEMKELLDFTGDMCEENKQLQHKAYSKIIEYAEKNMRKGVKTKKQ